MLRDDGLLFVNLADSYNGSGGAGGDDAPGGLREGQPKYKGFRVNGLKPKDLIMVPARFALAAQADGWYLRNDLIGVKMAPMPESVTDRFTRSHEHVFMLAKAQRYFSDMVAVAEQSAYPNSADKKPSGDYSDGSGRHDGGMHRSGGFVTPATRNARDVFTWSPQPFAAAHFATWPEAIPERFIKMATSARGAARSAARRGRGRRSRS